MTPPSRISDASAGIFANRRTAIPSHPARAGARRLSGGRRRARPDLSLGLGAYEVAVGGEASDGREGEGWTSGRSLRRRDGRQRRPRLQINGAITLPWSGRGAGIGSELDTKRRTNKSTGEIRACRGAVDRGGSHISVSQAAHSLVINFWFFRKVSGWLQALSRIRRWAHLLEKRLRCDAIGIEPDVRLNLFSNHLSNTIRTGLKGSLKLRKTLVRLQSANCAKQLLLDIRVRFL